MTTSTTQRVPGGAVHRLPTDMRAALLDDADALAAWGDITRLARNEFICWVLDAKQDATRAKRIRRTLEELNEGQRRPCCWPGCAHRERNGSATGSPPGRSPEPVGAAGVEPATTRLSAV